MPTHAELSSDLIRPPGTPPSTCPGELHRVDGAGNALPDDADPVLDACLPGEGEPGKFSAVRLWRCARCRATPVDATGPDGTRWLRNDYPAPTWDVAAGRPVDACESAAVA